MSATATALEIARPVRSETRIPALDGVRAIASLAVVLYHFGPHIATDSSSPFHFLATLPRPGNEGVDLFFVLSGFLISGILVNARASNRYFQTFYIRRACRIFPLYYLLLASYGVAVWVLQSRKAEFSFLFASSLPAWCYWLYMQNFFMAAANSFGAGWLAPTWSLAVEEQFYLTLPAIVRRVTDRQLAVVAGLAMIGPLVLRAIIQKFGLVSPVGAYVLLFTRVDALAAGILVMLATRHYSHWLKPRRAAIGILAGLTMLLWFVCPLSYQVSTRFQFTVYTQNALAFGLFLLYVTIAPQGWLGRFLSVSWMRMLGNMAYSTYMFHLIVLWLAFLWLRGSDPALSSSADFLPILVALVLTLLLSFASFRFFEKPLMQIGHRYSY